jgi:hypothetical protein
MKKALLALTALTFVVASCGNAQTTTDTTSEPVEPALSASGKDWPYPREEGECLPGVVAEKQNRFDYYSEEDPDFNREVAVTLAYEIPSGDNDYPNGGIGIYAGDQTGRFEGAEGKDFMASDDFLPGSEVEVCLLTIPDYCPEGDPRGRVFALTDNKTGRVIQGRQGWNDCGGA